ncbi:MAG TPA: hypothetical protein ENJ80_04770 [Gammaproteobacteria bacterium]|nr:hypothetical protein [Gammaproteobacteria bacterium]
MKLTMRIAGTVTLFLLLQLVFPAVAGVDELLQRLRADYAALAGAEQDLRRHREQGSMDAFEEADYAAYVAYLRQRLVENCAALQRAGAQPPPDVECPATSGDPARSVAIDQDSEQTRDETTATLEAELNSGLGEFDEKLLREQARVKADRPRSESGSGSGGGAAGGAGGEAGEGVASDGGSETGGASQSGTRASVPPSGAAGGPGSSPPVSSSGRPADIPDGSDDDVVARQLREAAEQETDPELKKKLWEEYRKYKQGIR